MKDARKVYQKIVVHEDEPMSGVPEGMIKTPEGQIIPIPKRSRRGRKGRRKISHPLRDIRLSRDMTLEELAEISGLSPSYLSRLESGSRRLNVDTISRLSDALKCDPGDLLSSSDQWVQRGSALGYNIHSAQTLAQRGPFHPSMAQNASAMAALVNQQIPLYETNFRTGTVDFSSPTCHIPAPAEIASVPGAYAFTAADHTMEPRFYKGDRLLVHPGKPLSPRSTAFVVTREKKVVLGEFVAWRNLAELNLPLGATKDSSVYKDDEYVLELKQLRSSEDSSQERETSGPIGQVLLYHHDIASIARVIGMVEG